MPDLCPEALSISKAAALIAQETGHHPHPATLIRWAQQGRLRTFKCGRRRLTTRGAVLEMLAAFNAPKDEAPAQTAPRSDVRRAGAAAAARIARTGG